MSKWKHYHVAYHRQAQRDSCIHQNASPLAKKVMENEFERSYVRYAKSKHPQSVRYARWVALGA